MVWDLTFCRRNKILRSFIFFAQLVVGRSWTQVRLTLSLLERSLGVTDRCTWVPAQDGSWLGSVFVWTWAFSSFHGFVYAFEILTSRGKDEIRNDTWSLPEFVYFYGSIILRTWIDIYFLNFSWSCTDGSNCCSEWDLYWGFIAHDFSGRIVVGRTWSRLFNPNRSGLISDGSPCTISLCR